MYVSSNQGGYQDRDALRFLWWKDGVLENDPQVYRMTVHLFGAASSPSCACFSLRQAAEMFGSDFSKQAREAVNNGFYVDDLLISVASVEVARMLAHEMTSMLAKAGFTLTKWISNHEEALANILQDQCSKLVQELPSDDKRERVLGVEWDIKEDKFLVKVDILPRLLTRRGILSMIHSLFESLGFLAPITIEPKLLLRRLNDCDWDAPVNAEEAKCWGKWISSLSELENVTVPRCLTLPTVTK